MGVFKRAARTVDRILQEERIPAPNPQPAPAPKPKGGR